MAVVVVVVAAAAVAVALSGAVAVCRRGWRKVTCVSSASDGVAITAAV